MDAACAHGAQSWLSKTLLPAAVPCQDSRARAGGDGFCFSCLLQPCASLAPVRWVGNGRVFEKQYPTKLCSEFLYAKPVFGRAASRCCEKAAAAHVEGWTSHFGSFSLKMLGGTEVFLCSLLFYSRMFASPLQSGVVPLLLLKKEQFGFFFKLVPKNRQLFERQDVNLGAFWQSRAYYFLCLTLLSQNPGAAARR